MRRFAPLLQHSSACLGFACVVVTLLACRSSREREQRASAPSASSPRTPPAPVFRPDVVGLPRGAAYDLARVAKIPDACKDAQVVLATAPKALAQKKDFFFRVARQVFVANPEFRYVPEFSSGPAQVVFAQAERKQTGDIALVAMCSEASTCNRLAAIYKTVVPSSEPEGFCGKPPGFGELGASNLIPVTAPPRAALPTNADVVGQCVRLAACRAARDGRLEGDPALECQKHPAKFKLSCAKEFPCAALLACLEAGTPSSP
jgi:hypothetical protein